MEIWHALYSYCRLAKLRIGWDEKTIGTKQTVALCVAFSPDGRYIMMGNEYRFDQGYIELWDVETGKCLHNLKGHTKTVSAVAFSPDGRFALSGSWDKTLRLWELGTMSCLHTLQGHKAAVTTVAFSPDGRYLLSGDYDKNLLLWDGRTGKCLRNFKGHEEGISSVAFSPDGRFVISGSGRNQGHDYSMRRWDVNTGQCLGILTHKYSVSSVAYSPNGRYILVGCYDKAIRLCDPETMKCPRVLVGHERLVSAVAFSPDGRYALSGSSRGEIVELLSEVPCRVRLWDLETGKCIQTLMGHKGGITSVAFSPDGRYAISSGKDCKIYLWKLDWDLEANPVTDWDELARPYLDAFLILHTPLPSGFFKKRSSNPSWTEEDLQELLRNLGHAGFGWIRPEIVRRKLKEIVASGSAVKG
jgi:WD40 repeat protein